MFGRQQPQMGESYGGAAGAGQSIAVNRCPAARMEQQPKGLDPSRTWRARSPTCSEIS